MPLDYTGDDTATQAPSPLPAKNANPISRLPVDGEALNVASIYQFVKMLTDGLDTFFDRGAWIDAANTFSALQTLNGAAGDTNAAIDTTVTPTARKLLWRALYSTSGAVNKYLRFYASETNDGLEITLNAAWDGAEWDQDSGAKASVRLILQGEAAVGTLILQYANPAGSFAEGAWVTKATFDLAATTLTMGAGGSITAPIDVTATAGAMLAGTTVTGGTGVVATTGNVEATAGGGRFKRLHTIGTAWDGSEISINASWGDAATVTNVTANDQSVDFRVNCAGAGIVADPTITLNFKDADFGVVPTVIVAARNSDEAWNGANCSWVPAVGTVTIVFEHTPITGKYYEFSVITLGRGT